MSFDWERFEDGTEATSSDINGAFTSIQEEVNDLPELSIQPRSLHHAHIPSMAEVSAQVNIGTDQWEHRNTFIDYDDTTYSSYTHCGSGWHVATGPAPDYDTLGVTHDAVQLATGPIPAAGLHVNRVYIAMANIQVSDIDNDLMSGTHSTFVRTDYYAIFQFQVAASLGDWTTAIWFDLPISQRYVNSESPNGFHGDGTGGTDSGSLNIPTYKDVPLRMMLTPSMMTVWGMTHILGCRVVVAVWDDQKGTSVVRAVMQHANLSVFSLLAPVGGS